jgi:hypothetical protein
MALPWQIALTLAVGAAIAASGNSCVDRSDIKLAGSLSLVVSLPTMPAAKAENLASCHCKLARAV